MTKQITYEVTVYPDRTEWRLNGKFHRENDPAIEYANGTKYWLLNDKLHRENGPAIEWANGVKAWYLNDQKYSEEEFLAKTKPSCEGKIVEIDGKKYKLTAA